jgi:hypothetical protein
MSKPNIKDDLDKPIWGAESIAKEINRTKEQTYHLLDLGRLDADKIGNLWVSTPRRLRQQFQQKGSHE